MNYELDQINLINTDGNPMFKSSNVELWPILCMFGWLHPFLVAVFSGEKKPNDVSLLFVGDFYKSTGY